MNLAVIILAAGQGKRMKSSLPKVLHRLCGRPMIDYVVDLARSLAATQIIAVVEKEGPVAERLRGQGVELAFQPVRLGTGDATRIGFSAASKDVTHVLVLNGDVPLLRTETVRDLRERGENGADLTLLAADVSDPRGYGRVFVEGSAVRIVEDADATEAERASKRINAGVYFGDAKFFAQELPRLSKENRQGEYYLTDLAQRASRCEVICAPDEAEILGVNNREQLSIVEVELRKRKNRELMLAGVTMRDPAHTYVDWDVIVGEESELYPGVVLEGKTILGAKCTVYPGVRIVESQIAEGTVVLDGSVIESSIVGPEAHVGPMAHLRPGTVLGSHCRVGNFVETKKATFGDGSKAAHLSYIGDAEIGKDVNIGCGTITCNYDGVRKHKTVIEDGVFVGSDTQFVAPVRIGRGAVIASGTTVTEDVPPEALVLARAPRVVKENYAPRYWSKRREQAPEGHR